MANSDRTSAPSPTSQDATTRPRWAVVSQSPAWLVYLLVAALTAATLLVRLALGFTPGDPPTLIIFTFPIMLSAYLGGLGPGLAASALAALLANYFLLPPQYAFSLATTLNIVQTGSVLVAGTLISVLSEGMHRGRRRAEASLRLQIEAEADLHARERKLSTLLELLPVGISILDADHRVSYANRALEKILDLSETDLHNSRYATRTYLDSTGDPMSVERFASAQALRENRAIQNVETGIVKEDGSVIWTSVSAVPVEFPDWKLVVVTSDITTRKRAEDALHESEARYRVFFESSLDAILLTSPDGSVQAANPAACTMFRQTEAEICALGRGGLVDPNDPRMAILLAERARAGKASGELTMLRADGVSFPVEMSSALFQDQQGHTRSSIIVRDITERKRAETKMERQNQRLKILRDIDIAILAADSVEHIVGAALSHMRELIDCRHVSLALFDWGTNELLVFDAQRISQTAGANGKRLPLTMTQDRMQPLLKNQPVLIHDVTALPELSPRDQLLINEGVRSECLLPLFVQNELIGSFDLTSELPGFFDQEHIDLGREVANQVAIAITQSRLSERLEENEQKFSVLFHKGPFAASLARIPDGAIIEVNEEFEKLVGYSRAELIGKTSLELNMYADPATRARNAAEFHARGFVRNTELTFRRKSGDVRYLLVNTDFIEIAGEKHLLTTAQDVTEHRQAEERVRYQAHLLENVNDAIVASDEQYNLKAWNLAAERMYGWKAEEVLGRNGVDILQTSYSEADAEEMRRHIAELGQYVGEATQLRKDGTRIPIEVASSVLRDDTGKITDYVNVNRDITARKQAEAAMGRSADRLRALANASRIFNQPDLTFHDRIERIAHYMTETPCDFCTIRLLSDDGQQLPVVAFGYFDPADQTALAFLRDVAERSSFHVDAQIPHAQVFRSGTSLLLPKLDGAAFARQVTPELWSSGYRFQPHSMLIVALRVEDRSIGIMILGRSQPQRDAFTTDDLQMAESLADRAALAIENARLLQRAQDELAERQRAQAELEAERALLARRVEERTADLSLANAELARAARLKDEFLASMSHELRTPLNSILGRSQALQEQIYGPLTPKQNEVLGGLEESGRHLLSLINDILDLSKIEADQLDLQAEPLNVDLLCRMSVRMVAQTALKKRISVSTTVDSQVDTITADERRLKQILVNLLSNAVKFTPEGGKVGLEVQGDMERQAATFTVWDTGIGIADADLPKLFKPFVQIDSRLSRQYEGTGLGLALVRRLAEAHGGGVTLHSTPGQGSRFSVTLPWRPAKPSPALPLSTPAALPSPPPQEEHHELAGTSQAEPIRILLAEDNETNIELLEYYLSAKGFDVVVARDGHEVLARAQEVLPHVILMDIQMPGMDGLEAIRHIRTDKHLRGIPIMALTALAMLGDRERCLQAGADEYLTKPVDLAKLIETIERLWQRKELPDDSSPRNPDTDR